MSVSGTTLSITATDTGTGTINDDDGAAVTINNASASEGASMTFTVTLDKAVQGGLTVTPSYTNGTAASTDYTANTTALSFSGTKGETKTFSVSTTEDAVLEANETFTVGLSVSKSGVTATDTGTGTINNDDSATVTINDASADEGESMTFTVTLDEAVQGGLKVTPSFTDGTATEGTDYDENTTALTFTGTKGETETFTVSTTEDTALESNETFTVGLSVSGTTLSITATDTGTGTINDNDGATVTINDASATEGSGIEFTVTLDKAVPGGLKVTPSYTNGTTASTDYTKNTTALSFTGTANETKKFTVSTINDAVLEANETFTVGLSVSGTTLSITATDTGTGTINDNDNAAVTINNASADEGDDITFTVTLDKAVQGGLTVTPSFTDGTATEGTDYDENTTALTFSGTKGETETFTVSTTEDTDVEGAETFTVGLTVSGTTLSITATDTGTGTINDDDGAAVTINDASADEGDAITFTVTLGQAVTGGLTVTPSYTNGTAASTDYTANTTALSFTGTANEKKTFTVSTKEDAVLEANETFTVSLTSSNSGVTDTDTGTGTINNDDSAAVTINDASADEGESMTFTVTLDKAVQGGLTVTPSFTDGTATEGTDYDENTTALTFTGTANESKTFTVSTTQDTHVEGNETFTVSLTASNAGVTATDTGTGTINDDESATVTINDASASEGDKITFTVTLNKAVHGGFTVTPSYTNGTAASADYTANTTALSFTGTANETQTFTVSTKEDAVLEGNETFTVGLTSSNAGVTATDTGTGTINNDDSAAVTINDASAGEGESMTFTVTLDKAVQGGLTVTPSFTNGTATEGTDYDENTTALSFTGTADETKTFTVSTTEDAVLEGAETFTVGLTVSGTTLSVTATDTGTGTINNDDSAKVTIADASADEGDDMTFTVALDKAVQGGLTVTPSYTDGTATEGTDYDENTTALTFTGTANETKTFTVSTTEDAVLEGAETFTIGLTASKSGVTATDTGTGTINNDDSAKVTIADASASEGGDITFTVTLDKAVQGGLKVTPSFTDGTATEGTDYDENTTALTFTGTANETKTFTVSTTNDAVLEANETFTVGLSVSGTTLSITATDTGTGTINNDDSAAVTVNDASADEGDSMTFTVTLDNVVQGGLKVTPSYTNGTAASTDYDENTTALTFTGTANETQTFTVQTTEDGVLEADETFTVGLSTSNASVTSTDTGTGTINNDDTQAPRTPRTPRTIPPRDEPTDATVTINDASANEGDSMTFTVTLDSAVPGGLTVTPSFTNGTATEGTDYDGNTAALSFTGTANETKTFTVSTTEDTQVEGTETFTVGLSVSGTTYDVTATDTGTGTINDDDTHNDDARPTVALSGPTSVQKGAFDVTITFSESVTGFEQSDISVTNGSATAFSGSGANYTATITPTVSGTVTVDVGANVAQDGAGNGNTAATPYSVQADLKAPPPAVEATVTVNDASASEGTSLTFTVTLDKAVPGGLTVTPSYTDGTATAGSDYTANTAALTFTGTASETQTFTVATQADGAVENNETFTVGLGVSGTSFSVTATDTGTGTIQDHDVRPTVVLHGPAPVQNGAFDVNVTFSKSVTGFEQIDISVTNGSATAFSGSGANYTATITPTASGTVAVGVGANVAQDGAGNGNDPASPYSVQADLDAPTVALSGPQSRTGLNPFDVTITFSESVTGFVQGDLTVGNGSATSFSGSGASYTATITPTASGTVTVTIAANVAQDQAGNGNQAPTPFSVQIVVTPTTVSQPDDQPTPPADDPTTPPDDQPTPPVDDPTSPPDNQPTPAVDDPTSTPDNQPTPAENDPTSPPDDQPTPPEDEPSPPDAATVTVSDASASEGTSLTFTVRLDKAVPGGLTVTPSYTDGTATAGSDYIANTAALTFTGTASETQTFTVATQADGAVENNETFTVGLGVSGTAFSVTATDTGTGTIQDHDVRPTVVLNGPAPVQNGAFDVNVTFSKFVTGFEQSDLAVTNGSATAFSGSGANYTATITPTTSGTVTVNVEADVAQDGAGNGNQPAVPYSLQADLDAPTVALSGPRRVIGLNPFDVTITFTESVTGFEQSDLSVGNGSATSFSGSEANYTATITPTANDAVTVTIAANVAQDQAGNGNQAPTPFSVQIVVAPTTVSQPDEQPTPAEDDPTSPPDESVSSTSRLDESTPPDKQPELLELVVNEGPKFAESNRRSVAENTPAGQPLGAPVSATDGDGDVLTYSLAGEDAASFALDADSGQVRTLAALDYESRTTYAVVVEVSDGQGGTARQPVTITVTDENEPPDAPDAPVVTGTSTTSLVVVWTAPSTEGRPPISDYDVQYRIANSGDAFIDVGFDGLTTTTTLNGLRPDTAYEVQVRAHNDEGVSTWSAPGIGRTHANTAPTFATGTRDVVENTPSGQPIGAPVSATDAEGDALTYALSGEDATSFTLDADSGQLRTLAALDYESRTTYAIIVEARDGLGGQTRQPVTISVLDENEPPDAPDAPTVTATTSKSLAVAWTAPLNVGRPLIDDYDVQYRVANSGDTFTDAGFDGTGTTTTLEGLRPGTAYEVQIRAHNDEGASSWSAPGMGRTHENARPTFADGPAGVARAVAENTPSGQPIGAPVSATDGDGDAPTYSLAGEDAKAFALDADSGQVRTVAALDYESRTTYAVVVEVSDGQGGHGSPAGDHYRHRRKRAAGCAGRAHGDGYIVEEPRGSVDSLLECGSPPD